MGDEIKADDVFNLLKQTTSLAIVSDFLKAKGLHHSASSWDALYKDRILPYVLSGELIIRDLLNLLRSVEEHGKQHIFLYKCKETLANDLINKERIKVLLHKKGLGNLLENPRVLDQPPLPTIVDIRIEGNGKPVLVIKIVEQRTYQRLIGEESTGNNTLVRTYQLVKERAVNVFKLNGSGLLEIRVGSHSNTSEYFKDLTKLQKLVSDFINIDIFHPISLANAKNTIWNDRDLLMDKIRYSDFTFKNDQGTTLRAASGSEEDNLFNDEGAILGISEFINHEGYCQKLNIWFVADEKNALSKDIHVLLPGVSNEFAITANCTQTDYDYVFSQLENLNS